MSIATQIERLQQAKSDIIDAIETKGVLVPTGSTMDDMADLILQIGGQETEPEISSYIIDQRIDPTNPVYKVPEDMVLGTAAKDDDRLIEYSGETVYRNVIRRIRANSHIYIGNYKMNFASLEATVNFLLVSDYDKTKWVDGTTIVTDFEDRSSDSYYYNWFMKLPEFWWKIEELETDLYKVSFTMTEQEDNSWKHWEGNTFIGVYKSSGSPASTQENSNLLVSRPNVTICATASWNLQLSSNWYRSGARPLYYREHQIMALLGMGWYGSTDVTRFVGNDERLSLTGVADTFGMLDTIADFDYTKAQFNNFWGLENWIGGNYELLSDLSCNITADQATVNFYANGYSHEQNYLIDSVTIPLGSTKTGCITKLKLGAEGYLLPTDFYTNSNYNRCYANFGGYSTINNDIIATRSSSDSSVGGLTYINFKDAKNLLMTSMRLVYEGDYHIVDNINDLNNISSV